MDKHSAPSFSFRSKFKQIAKYTAPGPCSYQTKLKSIQKSSSAVKFGKSERKTFQAKDGPSPFSYQVKFDPKAKSSSSVFCKSQRDALQNQTNLGPGSYNPEYQILLRKSSTCKFSKSVENSKQSFQAPGPGVYDPNEKLTLHKNSTAVFGKSQRQNLEKSSDVGPGHYSVEIDRKQKQPVCKFTTSKREFYSKDSADIPGPNSYKIEGEFQKGLRQKKGSKLYSHDNQQNPTKQEPSKQLGPGSYHSEKVLRHKRNPAYSMQKSQRPQIELSSKATPSPNLYQTLESKPHRSTSALITQSKRDMFQNTATPGPGAYEKLIEYKSIGSKSSKFTIPKGRIQSSLVTNSLLQGPGPCTYNPSDSRMKATTTTIGNEGSGSKKRPLTPGPGTYDSALQTKIKGSIIGKEPRKYSTSSNSVTPGPNSYNIPSSIGNLPQYAQQKNQTHRSSTENE